MCAMQDLNPVPFAVTFACSSTWIAYGFLSRNIFMFPQNIVGFVTALFNSMVCFGCASYQVSSPRTLPGLLEDCTAATTATSQAESGFTDLLIQASHANRV